LELVSPTIHVIAPMDLEEIIVNSLLVFQRHLWILPCVMELEIVQHVINVTVLWVTVEINAKKMNVLEFGQPTPLMHALESPKEIVQEETLVAVRLVTQGMNVNSPFVSQLMDPFLLFVQVKESVWM
jgi:hypothetical protein